MHAVFQAYSEDVPPLLAASSRLVLFIIVAPGRRHNGMLGRFLLFPNLAASPDICYTPVHGKGGEHELRSKQYPPVRWHAAQPSQAVAKGWRHRLFRFVSFCKKKRDCTERRELMFLRTVR
jgi:hypothetical protein